MGQPIRGMTRPIPVSASIIPSVIPPDVVTLDANFNASIHNRFDIEVIDAQTGKIKQRAQAENVICSQLWTRLFAPATYFNYIHYGTGSGTPASTNTSLFSFLGCDLPSNNVDTYDATNGIYSLRRKIQLSESTAVGSTLTEVGIGYSNTSATLCTHAMLKDANGNQISIAKTNTDIINIYATIYVHFSANGYDNNSIIVSDAKGGYPSICGWLLGIGSVSMGIAAVSSWPMASMVNHSGYVSTIVTYNSANKKVNIAAARFAAGAMNLSGGIYEIGIGQAPTSGKIAPAIILRTGGSWYSGATITAEAVGTGDGSTKDFSTAFPFISNATIYVNGVAQSAGVTVNLGVGKTTDVGRYFQFIPASSGTYADYYSRYYSAVSQDGAVMAVYYNPQYEKGIDTFYSYNSTVYVSNDLASWTALNSKNMDTVTVPTAYKNYKYWRIADGPAYNFYSSNITSYNIHFATPPASGAVITADYHTPVIAKDANHVFDLTVTIQLGEYTS